MPLLGGRRFDHLTMHASSGPLHPRLGVRSRRQQTAAEPAARRVAPDPRRTGPPAVHLRRYLPLALLTTGVVIVLPPILASSIVPSGTPWLTLACAALSVAISVTISRAGAAMWKRQPGSRNLPFGELMLWGWLRRLRTERHLGQARALFESARKAGSKVGIEPLMGLSRLIEAREPSMHGHGERVARHARCITRRPHTVRFPADSRKHTAVPALPRIR